MERDRFVYKMKDLCTRSGMPRQAIHFYIREGLLPEGRKTGKNVAFYSDAHLDRLRLIKQLQHERFLPLKVIKAVLDEHDGTFDSAQRRQISEVKRRLPAPLAGRAPSAKTVDAASVLRRTGVDRRDLEAIADLGLVSLSRGPNRALRLPAEDVWMVELWADVRDAGFTRARGFGPDILSIFEEAVSRMFEKETRVLRGMVAEIDPAEVATMVERVLPLIHAFLVRYHETKVRAFFSTM
jgi:DNA-binding transcriptional MerR regulator